VNDAHLEILSRFFDGETVDPRLLAEALAQPDAAHYLTECAALRTLARDDEAPPSEGFYERTRSILTPGATSRSIWRWLIQPALAASLVLVGAALGSEYATRRVPAPPAPPAQIASTPVWTLRDGERVPGAGGGVTTLPSPRTPAAQPAPSGERRRPAPAAAVPIPDTHRHFGQWRELPGGEEAR